MKSMVPRQIGRALGLTGATAELVRMAEGEGLVVDRPDGLLNQNHLIFLNFPFSLSYYFVFDKAKLVFQTVLNDEVD